MAQSGVESKGGVFIISMEDGYKVHFEGVVLRYSFLSKGAAQACLDLLNKRYGVVTKDAGVAYK